MNRRSTSRRVAFVALSLCVAGAAPGADDAVVSVDLAGRPAWVHVPARLPPAGARALVVVLHGGGGSARRIASGTAERSLNLDAAADAGGFVVAYLNGTPVARMLGEDSLGWNAGACCGMPARNRVDDVGYLGRAIDELVATYGVDRRRVYGIGHSNGAMMAERFVCETGVMAAAVAVSGALEIDVARCPAARGRRILAIHGADDRNVPVAGGRGSQGLSGVSFRSQAHAQTVFVDSGASYRVDVVAGASHRIDMIDDAMRRTEGVSIAQKAARFFGLDDPPR